MKKNRFTLAVFLLAALSRAAEAVPPLEAGDAPTADKHHVEWYVGHRYEQAGEIARALPSTELVYGITERQEITIEVPYLAIAGKQGFGDAVLGTNFLFLKEGALNPGVSTSFEWKLANGSQETGLGSGAQEQGLLLRVQKTAAWFTGFPNLG